MIPRAAQSVVDYTSAPIGLRVEGRLWTGQPTTVTQACPNCGRIGVAALQYARLIVVHTGRVSEDKLHGIDYCTVETGRDPDVSQQTPDR
jgi:hypothetical protein